MTLKFSLLLLLLLLLCLLLLLPSFMSGIAQVTMVFGFECHVCFGLVLNMRICDRNSVETVPIDYYDDDDGVVGCGYGCSWRLMNKRCLERTYESSSRN